MLSFPPKTTRAYLTAMKAFLSACFTLLVFLGCAQPSADTAYVREHFSKKEFRIPMRDGTKLYTVVYTPKDSTGNHPFLMVRTPYSAGPYGEGNFARRLHPNPLLNRGNFIFVFQDVRGRYMSEGQFTEVTPFIAAKKTKTQVDESTDTWDTVDWLVKNVKHNNGAVGITGISYPGFYATASLPGAHPAIKAVSPQAPVTDEFEGDDVYHRGAFFLMDNFSFENFFDAPRSGPRERNPVVDSTLNIRDAYDFYLKTGALRNFNERHFKGRAKIWNEYLEHDTKDAYWQARDIRKHLLNVKPATLVVGGWFDAEDLFGALHTYGAIERQNPSNKNFLVMAPWTHGAWAGRQWDRFAGYRFGQNLNDSFQKLEADFFNDYLTGKGSPNAAEATVFVTGSNEWKRFSAWPPKEMESVDWYLSGNHELRLRNANNIAGSDAYISDPANPVPYIDKRSGERINAYMAADQRFAARRSDVLFYQSEPLNENLTVLGPITANLYASLTGTDADFVVKVIDVLPDSTQQLVRAEVLRGKFRNSFEKPEPFVPGKPTQVKLVLNDAAHTFVKGHRIMLQIQSSWFPLVDRNPQKFMRIPLARDDDYKAETITIWHDAQRPSSVQVQVLR